MERSFWEQHLWLEEVSSLALLEVEQAVLPEEDQLVEPLKSEVEVGAQRRQEQQGMVVEESHYRPLSLQNLCNSLWTTCELKTRLLYDGM